MHFVNSLVCYFSDQWDELERELSISTIQPVAIGPMVLIEGQLSSNHTLTRKQAKYDLLTSRAQDHRISRNIEIIYVLYTNKQLK